MKNIFRMAFLVMLISLLCVATFIAGAAEDDYTYVYVNSETGIDASGNGGSPDNPLKTWTWGVKYGQKENVGTLVVVFTNEYHFNSSPTEVAHDYPIIFTTSDGKTDYAKENGAKLVFGSALRYYLNGDTAFENITIEYSKSLNIIAQYNPVRMGKGVKTVNLTSEKSQLLVLGGYQAPKADVDVTKDSHVTIEDGDYYIVAGGTRDSFDKTPLYFTGTHYMTVNGGRVANFYGGSVRYQYSTSADITVNGGYVENFHVGGDLSRRLNGDASATFNGGEIKTLNVNNIIGTGKITVNGTKIGSMSVWYANDEVSTLNEKTNKPLYLYYNANYYTPEEIEAFKAGFDYTENIAKVYVKAGASGGGNTEADPTNFADAFNAAAKSGSTIVLLGNVTVDNFAEPAHLEKVLITGRSSSVTLTVNGTYTLSGETEFGGITLDGGMFNAEDGVFETANDVKTGKKLNITGSAILCGGLVESVTNAKNVIVNGANVETIVGADTTVVEVNGGSVKTVKSSKNGSESFCITINGGDVQKVIFNNISKSLVLKLLGGKVGAFESIGTNAHGKATLGDGVTAEALESVKDIFEISTDKVYFIRDGGTGNGGTFASAGSSFDDAYIALGTSGGTIVVCGKVTITAAVLGYNHKHEGKVTVTSIYDGVDYRKENGAKIVMKNNYHLGGETEFNSIYITSEAKYKAIAGEYHKLVIGEGIVCDRVDGQTYPVILGGGIGNSSGKTTDVTIKSGMWGRIRGGASGNATECTVNLKIEGGEFYDAMVLGSTNAHTGDINVTFTGGTMYASVVCANITKEEQVFDSNVNLNIAGGTFYNKLLYAASANGTYSGVYNVNITGGEFAHLVEFTGSNNVDGVPSFINSTVDLGEIETGTYTFTNYVRKDGADPWLFYHDGFYYYTSTTGSPGIGLTKTANIGDLIYTTGKTVFLPEEGTAYSASCWSPEIHHYTDEEVGEGNGGWYLYFAGSGGETENDTGHRMYVLKCLDGDNLLGRWGNPITGEGNVPEKVSVELDGFNDRWSGGQTDIRIGGKVYNLFVAIEGEPNKRNQNINIVEMTNPWTIKGKSTILVRPEYDWEIGRHTTLTIVECGTAVYGDDGSIYIVYSACGYNTPEYKLGQLKFLGGDPLDANNWEKHPEPILSMNEEICGIGSASYVDDPSGQGWICYNAYLGTDTNGGRYAFVEPYYADTNGVVISEGTTHPSSPDRVYTQVVNPNPVINKICGFTKVDYTKNPFAANRQYTGTFTDVSDSHWFKSYVANAYERSLANGTSQTKFSPDSTFNVAQALTAAANIHTAYFGKTVRAAQSGEAWYVPYVEYCVQNGIITEGQFVDVNANITRGDMAVVFANILPDSEYGVIKEGSNPDVTSDMACFDAVAKLYNAGIVGGDAGTGNYRPSDTIKRSEACVIFTRIALKSERVK